MRTRGNPTCRGSPQRQEDRRGGCTNKPNLGRRPAPKTSWPQISQISADFRERAKRRKRRRTVTGVLPSSQICENLCNLRLPDSLRRPNHAKQTQFPASRAAGVPDCAKQSQFFDRGLRPRIEVRGDNIADWDRGAASGLRGPVVQTNPISAAGAVESPHCSTIPSFHHSKPLSIVPNKANSRAVLGGTRPAGRGARDVVQTNPISARATARASALWERSYGESDIR